MERDPITEEINPIVDARQRYRLRIFLGGSRVMAPDQVTESTDYDYMVYCPITRIQDFLDFVKLQEFTPDDGARRYAGDVLSLRNGLTNLILTTEQDVYDKYRTATTVGKLMPEVEKSRRIEMFNIICRGEHHAETPREITRRLQPGMFNRTTAEDQLNATPQWWNAPRGPEPEGPQTELPE